jgi:hypothetical protein
VSLSSPEIAYLAGVLDVAARIRLVEAHGTSLPDIYVATPNMDLLGVLSAASGVKAFTIERDYNSHVCNEHCPSQHSHRVSVSGRWECKGARAVIMLAAMTDYLELQRDAAEECVSVGLKNQKWSKIPAEMAALGWPVPEEWQ